MKLFRLKYKKRILLIPFLFNIAFSYSVNDNLKQVPPKYNVLLNKYEYFILINSIQDGVLKYSGKIDYNIEVSNKNGEIIWEWTTNNKNVLEVVSVYVAQKSIDIVREISSQKRLDEELLNAISSLSLKLENAVKSPIYALQTLAGQVTMENEHYYFVTENGDKRVIRDFSNDMQSIINKPIVVEGYIKNESFIVAERYRFVKNNTLELFVMSQCPYGIEALKYVLRNDSLLESNHIQLDIRFIFYKNGNIFTSLHGENEIRENLILITLRDKYSKYLKPYLRERINRPNDTWQNIASAVGLKQSEIKQILNTISESRETLILTEYKYTTQIYNGINASPSYAWESVLINSLQEIPVFVGNSDLLNTQQCNGL